MWLCKCDFRSHWEQAIGFKFSWENITVVVVVVNYVMPSAIAEADSFPLLEAKGLKKNLHIALEIIWLYT